MRLVLLLFLTLQSHNTIAGELPQVLLDPEIPVADQGIDVIVLGGDCSYPSEYSVDVQGKTVKVFVRFLFGSVCPDPPPPPQLRYQVGATINGLPEGGYTLQYFVLGVDDDLPPMPADEQTFFIEEIQFEVRGSGASVAVNSLNDIGIISMILLIFGVGFLSIRRLR